MNLAESLLHALKDHGANRIFGIPGDFALPLFKVIEESGILPLHTLSHEPGVGFAADGAARIGGGLGVAAVTYGAGAFNLVNAVACAAGQIARALRSCLDHSMPVSVELPRALVTASCERVEPLPLVPADP